MSEIVFYYLHSNLIYDRDDEPEHGSSTEEQIECLAKIIVNNLLQSDDEKHND